MDHDATFKAAFNEYSNPRDVYARHMADIIPAIIWETGPDSRYVYLNKRWQDYTGLKHEDGSEYDLLDAVHPDEASLMLRTIEHAHIVHAPFEVEYRLRDRYGQYKWHLSTGEPKFGPSGDFEGFVGTSIDIHSRKEAEEVLRRSELYYKTYTEALPQMAFIADGKGNIIFYNRRWYEYIGSMEGAEGWGWKDLPIHHPDDLQNCIDRWNHSLETGEPYEIEYRLRRYDGE